MAQKRFLSCLFFALFFAQIFDFARAATLNVKTASGETVRAANQVLVRYKNGRAANVQSRVMQTFGIAAANSLEKIGVDVLPVPATETMTSFLQKLSADPDVLSAEPNVIIKALDVPTDSGQQFYLGPNYLDLFNGWNKEQGSTSTVVAVIDTGITLTHTGINLWTDANGFHGTQTKIDWNGDGDCTDSDPFAGDEMCADSTPNDDNTGTFHGTRVSGIVGATANDGDVVGVCRNCRILAVKVLNSDGFGSLSSIITGIMFAADARDENGNPTSVINLSLGSSFNSSAEEAAINYAISKNIVVVAASGNDGAPCRINFPAAYNDVISVGATDSLDILADFSCSGGALDIVAPGVNIRSLSPTPGVTLVGDGTSFAAPMVAGVAALIRSRDPNMSVADVTRHINFNADDLGTPGYDGGYGFGRLDANRAIIAVGSGTTYGYNPGFPGETFPEPNPFRPLKISSVKIRVPAAIAPATDKKITFFNISGAGVKTLNCGAECEWDGKGDDGALVASGLYYYRVESSLGNIKGKITVIK